jgi:hypothetical protein
MFVHTRRCIFSSVMIGFYYKRKGLQTLFENCFEILEKEKKMEIFSLPSFWPEGLLLPLLCIWPLHKPLGHLASSPGSPAVALSSLLGPAPLFLFGPKLASPAPLVRALRNGLA